MALWKVHCLEDYYPGMWHRWYRHQCVAIGWPPPKWKLRGRSGSSGLVRARNALTSVRRKKQVVRDFPGFLSESCNEDCRPNVY